jgi:hypothetical protein
MADPQPLPDGLRIPEAKTVEQLSQMSQEELRARDFELRKSQKRALQVAERARRELEKLEPIKQQKAVQKWKRIAARQRDVTNQQGLAMHVCPFTTFEVYV